MAIEIEAKFRLSDPEEMRRRLDAAGATPGGKVTEDNAFFDTPDGSLVAQDCGLRVRIARNADCEPKCTLTYKGPRQPGQLKVRQEEEAIVASPGAIEGILTGLGYERTLSFQKHRESFALGPARIELDELPELGFFLEIEADDEQAVQTARQQLGLADEPTVTDTYVALVAELLEGTGRNELAF